MMIPKPVKLTMQMSQRARRGCVSSRRGCGRLKARKWRVWKSWLLFRSHCSQDTVLPKRGIKHDIEQERTAPGLLLGAGVWVHFDGCEGKQRSVQALLPAGCLVLGRGSFSSLAWGIGYTSACIRVSQLCDMSVTLTQSHTVSSAHTFLAFMVWLTSLESVSLVPHMDHKLERLIGSRGSILNEL